MIDLLEQAFPQARCSVVQNEVADVLWASRALQQAWWKKWVRPARRFGLAPSEPADMLWSNMGLHMQANPAQWMKQWASSLNQAGFVMFSCLGPDSLRELRQLYASLDWPAPSHEFTDMHDWGDMLLSAGFAAPIMDMERITLTYETPAALLEELRSLGRNLNPQRFTACRGRAWRGRGLFLILARRCQWASSVSAAAIPESAAPSTRGPAKASPAMTRGGVACNRAQGCVST